MKKPKVQEARKIILFEGVRSLPHNVVLPRIPDCNGKLKVITKKQMKKEFS